MPPWGPLVSRGRLGALLSGNADPSPAVSPIFSLYFVLIPLPHMAPQYLQTLSYIIVTSSGLDKLLHRTPGPLSTSSYPRSLTWAPSSRPRCCSGLPNAYRGRTCRSCTFPLLPEDSLLIA